MAEKNSFAPAGIHRVTHDDDGIGDDDDSSEAPSCRLLMSFAPSTWADK